MHRFTLVLSALLILPVLAADPAVRRDLSYAQPAHARQAVDVYSPGEGRGHPILFWIHGGGWQAGDKKEVDAKPAAFTERGFVFVSINYRLLGDQVTIRQMAEDVAKAIRWVRDRPGEHGGNPDRLFVMGHSAGAQLAALVCTDPRYLAAEKVPLSAVRGCIPVDGDTYDVPLQIATVEERRANRYREKFGNPEQQKELSPITHVMRGRRVPSFLILHVAEHPEVRMQSEKLAQALVTAGHRARVHAAPGKTHLTINSDLGTPGDLPSAEVWRFLERHRGE